MSSTNKVKLLLVILAMTLDKNRKGFLDMTNGQKIAPEEFGKNEKFKVKDTPFVREKIKNGELILVSEEEAEPEKVEPEKKKK